MGTTESKHTSVQWTSPQDIVKHCIHNEKLPLSAENAAILSTVKKNLDQLVDKLYKKILVAFQKQKTRKIVIKYTYIPMVNIQYIEKQLDTLFHINHNIRIEDMYVYYVDIVSIADVTILFTSEPSIKVDKRDRESLRIIVV